jgi:hypothetical protein
MMPKQSRIPILVIGAALFLVVLGLVFFQPARPVQAGSALPLKAPPFQAAASPQDAAALAAIADEAGIAAYFQSSGPITLASVRDRFRTIEAETGDYIIGSIDVQDYRERFDVHAYVHRDGWFMVYYLKADPAAKIVDLMAYSGGTAVNTIFDTVLTTLAAEAGVTFGGATFWHFQYPNANRLTIIVEDFADGNEFTVKLPAGPVFSEISWSVKGDVWRLDENNLDDSGEPVAYGTLTPPQMVAGPTYTVAVGSWHDHSGSLVMVYRTP